MKIRIEDIKPGAKIRIGKYAPRVEQAPEEIIWRKADKGRKIVSEYAIDCLAFDAPEIGNPETYSRVYGNSSYELSNIRNYMNSDEPSWFKETHIYDRPPAYKHMPGFLYHFAEHETEKIECVDLLSQENITAGNEEFLPVFRKMGIRPHSSHALCESWKIGFHPGGNIYMRYWLSSSTDKCALCVEKTGRIDIKSPSLRNGLRPVISLFPATEMQISESGEFVIAKAEPCEDDHLFSDEDLFSFLGMR